MTELSGIEKRYRDILDKISKAATASGRNPHDVKLVAVSKTHPIEAIEALYRLGQRDFGENYVQELIEKAKEAKLRGLSDIRWHFIGHLQSNKVKVILPEIHLIHSVDSLSLSREISKRAGNGRKVPCLLSVNIDRESTKSGFLPDEIPSVTLEVSALPGIELRGLMCIPDPSTVHSLPTPFSRLRALGAVLQGVPPHELSMGMTSDFEEAIAEGATLIRIGTAIFGERK